MRLPLPKGEGAAVVLPLLVLSDTYTGLVASTGEETEQGVKNAAALYGTRFDVKCFQQITAAAEAVLANTVEASLVHHAFTVFAS